MANSYTEVTLTQAQTTGFTTPSYVDVGHLVVKVNDVVVPNTSVGATNKVFGSFTSTNPLHYLIIAGQTSLSFNEALPSGAKVHIQRNSSQNARLVDYSDASLLTADTMDRDANQIFFVAQEALDQSSLTNVAASDFYYSQGTEPATNTVGTLWYDTSSTPNVLKIRSSTGFELAAPIMTQVTLDGSALAAGTGTYSGYDVIPVGSDFNTKSALYLNGIKQVAGTSLGNNDYFQVGTNVYIPTVADTDVIQVISNAQNLDDVVNKSAAQTITGAKVFSANTDFSAGIDVTGNISVTGTVDNVDVAALSSSVSNVDNTSDADKPVSTATQSALNLKANIASPTFTGTVGGITSAMVGLSNVDNTTDANKPVSTATQSALNLKAPIASPTFTGTVTADGLTLGNDERIKLGTGSDFEIYQDGNNSIIKESDSSGSLTIQGENIFIKNTAGDKNFIHTGSNIDVRLSHDGDTKLQTTTGGVSVTGTVTADGLNVVTPDGTGATIDVGTDYLIVKCSDLESGLLVRSDSTASGATPDLYLRRTANATSGAENLGTILFQGLNNASPRENTTYASILCQQANTTDGDEDGKVLHRVVKDGTKTTILEVAKTGIDVNGTVTSDSFRLNNAGSEFNIFTDASDVTWLVKNGTGTLKLKSYKANAADSTTDDGIHIRTDDLKLKSNSGGDIAQFSYDSAANTNSVNIDGTVTADSITSAPTTVVTTNGTVPTVAVNKKYIDTYDSGVNAYVLPTGTVGQMITFVNASTQNITLNRSSITLEKVIAGSDPANVTDATITVGKSGAVEVVYTGTNTAVIFGSGIS